MCSGVALESDCYGIVGSSVTDGLTLARGIAGFTALFQKGLSEGNRIVARWGLSLGRWDYPWGKDETASISVGDWFGMDPWRPA